MRAEEMSYPELASWFARFATNHPDVFSAADLSKIWYWSHDQVEQLGVDTNAEKRRALVGRLRAGLLKRLRTAVGSCKKCPLHAYRLPGRPVLDDCDWEADPFASLEKAAPIGAVFAETMIVSEGPGEFEARTGTPFVSFPVLVGSTCARLCNNFEACYPKPEKPKRPGVKVHYVPAAPCNVVPLKTAVEDRLHDVVPDTESDPGLLKRRVKETVLEIQTERANLPVWDIGTVAFFLDKALRKAGFWRAGWNGQARLWEGEKAREAKEPDVYICNTVKCRSCVPDATASDGLSDRSPTKEHIEACDPWLRIQIEILQPRLIIALGNPAAAAVLGDAVQITKVRGQFRQTPEGIPVLLEVHPSWISRKENPDEQKIAYDGLLASFVSAKEFLAGKGGPEAPPEGITPEGEGESPFDETAEAESDVEASAPAVITEPEGPFDNPAQATFIPSLEEDAVGQVGADPENAS